ncbi:MAG: helix-turn-helix transcriptional regulator [Clostridia bacterium]|nr:helix-turn-helix transcriptional regulator [Clostridia bacterium]
MLLYTESKATKRGMAEVKKLVRTRLVNLRRKYGLTQQEVADKLQITRSFYSMIEINERNPTLNLAKKMAEMFHTNIEALFFTEDCNKPLQNALTDE